MINTDNTQVIPQLVSNFDFYVVERIENPSEDPKKYYYKINPLAFATKISGGFDLSRIFGFYLDEEEAEKAAHKQASDVYNRAKELEEKKSLVSTKLDKKINEYQKYVESCMKRMKTEPELTDKLQLEAETTLSKIKELRSKHKMVESSKKELKPLEETNKKKK